MSAILRITKYSEKAVIVTGDTFPHKERIKAAIPNSRAIWHRKAHGWIFSAKHEKALSTALGDLLGENLGTFSGSEESPPVAQPVAQPEADALPGKWGLLAEDHSA